MIGVGDAVFWFVFFVGLGVLLIGWMDGWKEGSGGGGAFEI